MPNVKIEIDFLGEPRRFENLEAAVRKYIRAVINGARKNLRMDRINATGYLYNQISMKVEVDGLVVRIMADGQDADYWQYVEHGVKGAKSDLRAPDSPFRFGTGTGPKGGLRPAIRQWIDDKPVQQWRNPGGTFMSYDQMAKMITRSVYLKGLKATNFISNPMSTLWDKYETSFQDAIVDDLQDIAGEAIPEEITVELG